MIQTSNNTYSAHLQLCREFFTASHYSQLAKGFTQYIVHCRDYVDDYGKNIFLQAVELEVPSHITKELLDHDINIYHIDKNHDNVWNYFSRQLLIDQNDQMCSEKIIYLYLQEKAFSCYERYIGSPFINLYCAKESSLFEFSLEQRIGSSSLCPEITLGTGYSEYHLKPAIPEVFEYFLEV